MRNAHPVVDQFISECSRPLEELKKVAAAKKLSPESLDFEILEIFTYTRQEGQSEFMPADEVMLEKLRDKNFLLDPFLEISQKFAIKIYNRQKDPTFHPVASIVANKSLSSVIAEIKKESVFVFTNDLTQKLYHYFNTMKVRRGLLIGIFEDDMRSECSRLATLIQRQKKLSENFTLRLCEAAESVMTVDSDIIYHYQKTNKPSPGENEKVNHSERGEIAVIKKDDLIIEYIKPIQGTEGRDCRGKYLPKTEPRNTKALNFTIDSSIRKEDAPERTRFYANKNGYIHFDSNIYSIKETLELESISFKTTGSLHAGVDSGTTVKVLQKDPMQDAIGECIKVEVTELIVEGNVGNRAEILTRHCEVKGQTHKTSRIYSEVAHLHVHKGYLKGREVTINRLEGGTVQADRAEINEIVGGTVYAREIYIRHLQSNAKINASEYMEIEQIRGEDNHLSITPEAFFGEQYQIDALLTSIDELKDQITLKTRKYEENQKIIQKNKANVQVAKARIEDMKKKQQRPPKMLINNVKDFIYLMNKNKALAEEITHKKAEKERLEGKIKSYSDGVFEAKVVHLSRWSKHNEVKFITITPRGEFSLVPKGNEKTLMLKERDGKFFVEAVH